MGLYTWAQYTPTPPLQSELPAQRCSGLDNKKADTPRSLNYRRNGVQDWTRRDVGENNACIPPTLEGWVYITLIHGPLDGPLYTWAQYTPTSIYTTYVLLWA